MAKFQRKYKLLVDTIRGGKPLEIAPPFSIEFDITRNILSNANTVQLKVHNLNENTRSSIYKDQIYTDKYRACQLFAGYGDELPCIFKGNISHCWSVREGTDMITTIEAYDAGFAFITSKTSASFPKGTAAPTIWATMVATMKPTVKPGVIGNFTDKIARANTYTGNSRDLLEELTHGAFFVDLETGHILQDFECLRGAVSVVTSSSGLLGTPVREETVINFDMIFEPRFLIGQALALESFTEKNFNGVYKVIGVKHKGVISDSVCGNAITSVTLWHGPALTVIN